jgi:microcin C transport system substrate-binding protein
MRRLLAIAATILTLSVPAALMPAQAATQATTRTVTALKQFGEPQFKPGFTHFPHVNPDAPKGGSVGLAESQPGTYDSLNTLILRGVRPRTLGLISDTLMVGSGWELDAAYAHLAESVEVPDDYGWAIFTLRQGAHWHDGTPITSADMVFTWDAIQAHGAPFIKSFLDRTAKVEALDDRRFKITLTGTGEIKPIIDFATTFSPQPKHWWMSNGRDISKTTLEPVLGSGPYRIKTVDAGRSITYERVADWWAKDLPTARGFYNFDIVKDDFYRDDDVMFEAFKAGAYDFRGEYRAQRWTTGYDFPAMKDGRVQKLEVPSELPLGAQGFRLNTRRDKFADPRVREALALLFDFDWIQKNILYGQYKRTLSNFPNSDFGAKGPPGPAELALLEPFKTQLSDRLLTQPFTLPTTDGSGNNRAQVREATRLFKEAGWEIRNGKLTSVKTGEVMSIEFLDGTGALTRVTQPYVETLRRVGIDASLRIVDTAQYQARLDEFDFDSIIVNLAFFTPPGTELRSYFGSAAAGIKGSANYSGIHDPVADALIEKALTAKDLDSVQAATRALDRVLLWGFYMVPQWHNAESWIAHKARLAHPTVWPKYDQDYRSTNFPATWWVDPASKAAQP